MTYTTQLNILPKLFGPLSFFYTRQLLFKWFHFHLTFFSKCAQLISTSWLHNSLIYKKMIWKTSVKLGAACRFLNNPLKFTRKSLTYTHKCWMNTTPTQVYPVVLYTSTVRVNFYRTPSTSLTNLYVLNYFLFYLNLQYFFFLFIKQQYLFMFYNPSLLNFKINFFWKTSPKTRKLLLFHNLNFL